MSTGIDGLRERVGEIEQPKNAWIEIARQAEIFCDFWEFGRAYPKRSNEIPDALVLMESCDIGEQGKPL